MEGKIKMKNFMYVILSHYVAEVLGHYFLYSEMGICLSDFAVVITKMLPHLIKYKWPF